MYCTFNSCVGTAAAASCTALFKAVSRRDFETTCSTPSDKEQEQGKHHRELIHARPL